MAETNYAWAIINGEPCIINNPTKPDTSFPTGSKWLFKITEKMVEGSGANNIVPSTSWMPNTLPDPTFPRTPRYLWHVSEFANNGNPYNGFMLIPEPTGAFRNAAKLEKVYIPESVKFIGAEAFRFTALKTVRIAADCEYSETSFPEGCELEFYGGGGTYSQLYDCDGKALLDCEAARIYVKSDTKEAKT